MSCADSSGEVHAAVHHIIPDLFAGSHQFFILIHRGNICGGCVEIRTVDSVPFGSILFADRLVVLGVGDQLTDDIAV